MGRITNANKGIMIVDALEWMTQHPFWALYAAILLGVAIHGFRPATRIIRPENTDEENSIEQEN